MTIEEQDAILAKEYAEAVRYMDNAEKTLAKAGKDGSHYVDKKYVRTACGTAYNGVLIALEAWLKIKGIDLPVNEPSAPQGKKRRISQKPRRCRNAFHIQRIRAAVDISRPRYSAVVNLIAEHPLTINYPNSNF